ncbi:pimeloyl-ACP methyl ester carboxylesterase [Streptomyces sp. CG 926]|uniref:alpha/beta fold hydrolase n=1 Tax=Streptomyces sp. CG 926 TaxID=1882405 RepID=UPI000D6B56A3|nr:alpha/beta hydrolase [Streptomyces sp. CG 926]PWK66546.1 pimeloyl-ACP methyl ester carboxylesterase [Streptomyces sp. CG 926]
MSARTLPEPTQARTRLGSGPGLVVAHGAGSSFTGTYGPILDHLTAHHTVVGVDYPGSGETPRATAPLQLDEMADQLVAAAVAEGLETFALHGYSLGGPVAIRAAARHPERVTALVLTATMARPNNQQDLTVRVWGKLAALGDRRLVSEFLFPQALSPQALEAMPAEQLEQVIAYAAADIADGTVEHAELATRVDVREDLAAIRVPTLVISTTADRLVPPVLHHHLAENIDGARLAELPTGHLPMVEAPEQWQHLITEFLAHHTA